MTVRRHSLMQIAGVSAALVGALSSVACAENTPPDRIIYDYEIVNEFPHDPEAFTQGLFFHDGFLYESTGLKGASSVRKVDIETGEVLQKADLPPEIFGEGITLSKGNIVGVTWRSQVGFVYDLESFNRTKKFTYPGEGWGITSDGKRLIMSDGSADLRFLDPKSLKEKSRVTATYGDKRVARLNELEFIEGEVYANIWRSDLIARIDPATGFLTGVIDLRSLREQLNEEDGRAEVLNGIAYDEEAGRLFVTGKNWPKLFEIKLIERSTKADH